MKVKVPHQWVGKFFQNIRQGNFWYFQSKAEIAVLSQNFERKFFPP
jgi:hypothetical protein